MKKATDYLIEEKEKEKKEKYAEQVRELGGGAAVQDARRTYFAQVGRGARGTSARGRERDVRATVRNALRRGNTLC